MRLSAICKRVINAAVNAMLSNHAMNRMMQPLKIAILAMGGEGGGVLADWLVDLGEHNGWIAQTTSVPGVAQRTGATIYYVELFPQAQATADAGQPVLALMPLPGDVDVVLASELMEAGRAVLRGLVTPERTTLITSTHRVYAISEKIAMGEGRVDSQELIAHAGRAAKTLLCFDMAEAAARSGSVISAVLFGALSSSGVLPFSRAQFEATIVRGGVGVKSSLLAFDTAYASRGAVTEAVTEALTEIVPTPPPALQPRAPEVAALLTRVQHEFPVTIQPLLLDGVRRLLDYQDPAYAALYLDRLAPVRGLPCEGGAQLLRETARHLALWMSYEDTIRVADLKTRSSRFARVQTEVGVKADQQLAIREFMHPRVEEICDTLPVALGRWLAQPHWAHRLLARMVHSGRIVSTSSTGGFLLLYGLSSLRRWRRSTLRFQLETARIEQWLASIAKAAAIHPALGLEVVQCQRLVKGYGDTHSRGLTNYLTLMAVVQSAGARLAAATLRELREAALADEHGKKLQSALRRHALVP
jgi:indolepyruvate ferredoxin oxidoreductase beta subunit